jgi:hypothetical protein
MPTAVELRIEHGDATAFEADVLALKYAQGFHGVDEVVAESLGRVGISPIALQLSIGQFAYVETHGSIRATHALFVGVPRLRSFSYPQIREFASQVLHILAGQAPTTKHLAMTIHGAGYGLDEVESCVVQVEGYLDALRAGSLPDALRRISIVDRDTGRVQRLRQALTTRFAENAALTAADSEGIYLLSAPPSGGAVSKQTETAAPESGDETTAKSHIFVAMSFSKQLDDVFHYGIQAPVHAAGYVCERMDHVAFAGEIISWLKQRIETADIVIAELSGSNPNVYLEVGYAWGKGRPTILLSPKVEELAFDVQGHRCLIYDSIRDLETQLTRELSSLRAH